ncbi:hypothetical protein CPJ18_24290 [Agrobacterium rosae]|uniref:Uncharacterized protein n=1 Tax=Agrobacterium rosae TaxID=1972867 RepID=A0AAE5RTZ7_9HYPH|nr:hypothetical protein DXM21_24045 [Agrobacterium rosae]KAA3512850.1 hypothetical protein DXM25_24235 [Agrobacterium rosae]MQB51187.1 hypothetical protein [Agrobacterium rosae]POO49071.1 hypothetical protein CPJ18_24290 [Agrobacterium rosae]
MKHRAEIKCYKVRITAEIKLAILRIRTPTGFTADRDNAFIVGILLLRVILVAIVAVSAILSVAMYSLAGRIETGQFAITRIRR